MKTSFDFFLNLKMANIKKKLKHEEKIDNRYILKI